MNLNSAAAFAVLASSAITYNSSYVNNESDGIYPYVTFGAPLSGSTVTADTVDAAQAQTDLLAAYNSITGTPLTIPAQLAGQNLGQGIYTCGSDTFNLDGTLTLTGNSSSVFIFKTGTLITEGGSFVELDGVSPSNVFWQVGVSATLNSTTFYGNILANQSITGTSSTVDGRLLAIGVGGTGGAVTLNSCTVNAPVITAAVVSSFPTGGAYNNSSLGYAYTGTFSLSDPNGNAVSGAVLSSFTLSVGGTTYTYSAIPTSYGQFSVVAGVTSGQYVVTFYNAVSGITGTTAKVSYPGVVSATTATF